MSPALLYWLFFRFGCVCFGGGYVLIPLIIAEMVEKRHLITLEVFGNLVSIAQVTPGPIGINSATYIGYIQGGVCGSLMASIGLVTPSLILGTTAVYFITRWKESFIIKGLLQGVRPASLGLLFFAVFLFMGMSVFTAPIPFDQFFGLLHGNSFVLPEKFGISLMGTVICLLSILLMTKTKLTTTKLIIGSAVIGAILEVLKSRF